MKIVYVEYKNQLGDVFIYMLCLNHVTKMKILINWSSKMTHATKMDEEVMIVLQAKKKIKVQDLKYYKQCIMILQDQELHTIISKSFNK